MKETRILMGMPVTIEIVEAADVADIATPPAATAPAADAEALIKKAFDYFAAIDERFSTYKTTSEISAINRGALAEKDWSQEMRTIFALAEETRRASDGYFNIKKADGSYDPSGIVKGWAIWNAAQMIAADGAKNFYVDAGGDVQTQGRNGSDAGEGKSGTVGKKWAVGIKNPWNEKENVKIVYLSGEGIATSGTYVRGLHIYNPKRSYEPERDIMSLTVVGPNVYEADRFATAAFAMGRAGIEFIERLDGFEGYMIDGEKVATMTGGFEKYLDAD